MFNCPLHAAEFELTPSADTFVINDDLGELAEQNFGASGGLAVSAAGSPKGEMQTLLRFDTSGIRTELDESFGTGQWSIDQIELQFNLTAPKNPVFNASASGELCVSLQAHDSWIEGTGRTSFPDESGLTFAGLTTIHETSNISSPLNCVDFASADSGAVSIPLESSPELQDEFTHDSALTLTLSFANDSGSLVLNSKEIGNAPRRPRLRISASAAGPVSQPASIKLTRLGNQELQLEWPSLPPHTETVQFNTTLSPETWERVEQSPTFADGMGTIRLAAESGDIARYFRVAP